MPNKITLVVGFLIIGVVGGIAAWHWVSPAAPAGRTPPSGHLTVEIVGGDSHKPLWERALEKAQEARSAYQAALKAIAEGRELDCTIKDTGPHLKRFEKALALIDEALTHTDRMMKYYRLEQQRKDVTITDTTIDDKIDNSSYGHQIARWLLLKRNIQKQITQLREK